MLLQKMLDIIQVQRHDFLNHLQVISGLSQLNKYERVREYIDKVSALMMQVSKTTRIKTPEVAAALLSGFNEAASYEINLELTVDAGMEYLSLPEQVAGEVVEAILRMSMKVLAPPEIQDRRLDVFISENEGFYICSLTITGKHPEVLASLENDLAAAASQLSLYGGKLELHADNQGIEINIFMPRKETKTG